MNKRTNNGELVDSASADLKSIDHLTIIEYNFYLRDY